MKNFWRDYKVLCKEELGFYKKHWKGVILLNATVLAAEYAWFFRDSIKDKMKDKFKKENEAQ